MVYELVVLDRMFLPTPSSPLLPSPALFSSLLTSSHLRQPFAARLLCPPHLTSPSLLVFCLGETHTGRRGGDHVPFSLFPLDQAEKYILTPSTRPTEYRHTALALSPRPADHHRLQAGTGRPCTVCVGRWVLACSSGLHGPGP